MANEYVSTSELKATVSLTGETYADPDLSLALTAASRAIDHVTGRRFWRDPNANQVRYYTPSSSGVLWIDDLETLTELAVDDDDDGTYEQVWTSGEYALEPANAPADGWPYTRIVVRQRRTSHYFPCWPQSVRVTGRFGWNATPDAIKQATGIVAARLVKRSREAPFGITGIGADGIAVRAAQIAQDPEVQLLIGPYVRVNHSLS